MVFISYGMAMQFERENYELTTSSPSSYDANGFPEQVQLSNTGIMYILWNYSDITLYKYTYMEQFNPGTTTCTDASMTITSDVDTVNYMKNPPLKNLDLNSGNSTDVPRTITKKDGSTATLISIFNDEIIPKITSCGGLTFVIQEYYLGYKG